MRGFWREFKAFALKGNVINLAVGVMIGAAFQSVVAALTEHILAPIIGVFGGANFDALVWEIPKVGITLGYGAFLTALINFFITALVIFSIVKAMNRLLESKTPQEAPATKLCPYCKSEVDIGAVRCKFCTSQLEEQAPAL